MPSINTYEPVDISRRKNCLTFGAAVLTSLFTGATNKAVSATTRDTHNRRIVSVGGALTEIVFALKANEYLVGVDTTSIYPSTAQKLTSVGYARSLSIEGVLALNPTQVIATEDAGPPSVLRQLSAAGIPVAVLAANHNFDGLLDRIQHVGQLTGRVKQATAMQAALRQEWIHVRSVMAKQTTTSTRILFILTPAPNQIMVAGTGTAANAMMEYVGATNAIDAFSGYKPLTPEAVIAARPDVILLTDQGLHTAGGIDGVLKLPGLKHTAAGSKRRVIALDAMFLLGFGPRFPAAVATLDAAIRKAIHA
jgi:iron complex transport system substrate-binding protein